MDGSNERRESEKESPPVMISGLCSSSWKERSSHVAEKKPWELDLTIKSQAHHFSCRLQVGPCPHRTHAVYRWWQRPTDLSVNCICSAFGRILHIFVKTIVMVFPAILSFLDKGFIFFSIMHDNIWKCFCKISLTYCRSIAKSDDRLGLCGIDCYLASWS